MPSLKKKLGTSPRPSRKPTRRLSAELFSTTTENTEPAQSTTTPQSQRASVRKLGDDVALTAKASSSEPEDLENIRKKLLHEAGKDVDYAETKVPFEPGKSWSKLLVACYKGDHRKVSAIIADDPNKMNAKTRVGWSPLHVSAACGRLKCVSILIRKQLDVDLVGKQEDAKNCKKTYIDIARKSQNYAKNYREIQELTPKQDNDGRTPLHLASRYGQHKVVSYLLKKGAKLEPDSRGQYPLHTACKNGQSALVGVLLAETPEEQRSTILSHVDKEGRTPLMMAVRSNLPALVKALVSHGAALDTTDSRGCDVVHVAIESGSTAVLVELIDKYKCNFEDNQDNNGERPIHKVATLSKLQRRKGKKIDPAEIEPLTKGCLEVLIARGVNPNVKIKKTGQTALHLAAIRNIPRIVSLLCQKAGANPSVKDKKKKTPLHYAIDEGLDLICSMLVSAGADVCLRYTYGPELPLPSRFAESVDSYNFQNAEEPLKKIQKLYEQAEAKTKKRDDLRVKKWQIMLGDDDSEESSWQRVWLGKKRRKLMQRVEKGIPHSIRPEAWRRFLKEGIDKMEENEGRYEELKETHNEAVKQIDLDVQRTDRNHVMFQVKYAAGQRALFHVLKAYANYDPEIGYCQGMSGIAEEESFWLLVELMYGERFNMRQLFKPGFPGLYEAYHVHKSLLAHHLPDLYETFERESVGPEFYGTRWFMTIFLPDILPKPVIYRIWDM